MKFHLMPPLMERASMCLLLAVWMMSNALAEPPGPVEPPSAQHFRDNGNGTVTDILTGLVWLKDANCSANLGGVNKTEALTWANALTWTAALKSGSCGLTDGSVAGEWRLPNRNELQSLLDLSRSSPALPGGHPFSHVKTSSYWSASTFAASDINGWNVSLDNGSVSMFAKSTSSYVWPARDAR